MYLEVVAPEEYLSIVLADLSRRRTTIKDVTMRGKSKVRRNLKLIFNYSKFGLIFF